MYGAARKQQGEQQASSKEAAYQQRYSSYGSSKVAAVAAAITKRPKNPNKTVQSLTLCIKKSRFLPRGHLPVALYYPIPIDI
jgi:hypothetical protein